MTQKQQEVLYVALDVEAAGPRLGVDGLLSVGACAVVRQCLSYDEYQTRGLLFYAELKPLVPGFDEKGMRVGSSHLHCLAEVRKQDPRFDPKHTLFDPALALMHMASVCEEPSAAAERFCAWLECVREGRIVIPLTDTVFFDSGQVSLWLNAKGASPLGHSGRDLKSLYQGLTRRQNARLKEVVVPRNRKPHRADYDAVELAQKGSVVLFEQLGW